MSVDMNDGDFRYPPFQIYSPKERANLHKAHVKKPEEEDPYTTFSPAHQEYYSTDKKSIWKRIKLYVFPEQRTLAENRKIDDGQTKVLRDHVASFQEDPEEGFSARMRGHTVLNANSIAILDKRKEEISDRLSFVNTRLVALRKNIIQGNPTKLGPRTQKYIENLHKELELLTEAEKILNHDRKKIYDQAKDPNTKLTLSTRMHLTKRKLQTYIKRRFSHDPTQLAGEGTLEKRLAEVRDNIHSLLKAAKQPNSQDLHRITSKYWIAHMKKSLDQVERFPTGDGVQDDAIKKDMFLGDKKPWENPKGAAKIFMASSYKFLQNAPLDDSMVNGMLVRKENIRELIHSEVDFENATEKQIIKKINYFLKIAEECMKQNDFDTAASILSALPPNTPLLRGFISAEYTTLTEKSHSYYKPFNFHGRSKEELCSNEKDISQKLIALHAELKKSPSNPAILKEMSFLSCRLRQIYLESKWANVAIIRENLIEILLKTGEGFEQDYREQVTTLNLSKFYLRRAERMLNDLSKHPYKGQELEEIERLRGVYEEAEQQIQALEKEIETPLPPPPPEEEGIEEEGIEIILQPPRQLPVLLGQPPRQLAVCPEGHETIPKRELHFASTPSSPAPELSSEDEYLDYIKLMQELQHEEEIQRASNVSSPISEAGKQLQAQWAGEEAAVEDILRETDNILKKEPQDLNKLQEQLDLLKKAQRIIQTQFLSKRGSLLSNSFYDNIDTYWNALNNKSIKINKKINALVPPPREEPFFVEPEEEPQQAEAADSRALESWEIDSLTIDRCLKGANFCMNQIPLISDPVNIEIAQENLKKVNQLLEKYVNTTEKLPNLQKFRGEYNDLGARLNAVQNRPSRLDVSHVSSAQQTIFLSPSSSASPSSTSSLSLLPTSPSLLSPLSSPQSLSSPASGSPSAFMHRKKDVEFTEDLDPATYLATRAQAKAHRKLRKDLPIESRAEIGIQTLEYLINVVLNKRLNPADRENLINNIHKIYTFLLQNESLTQEQTQKIHRLAPQLKLQDIFAIEIAKKELSKIQEPLIKAVLELQPELTIQEQEKVQELNKMLASIHEKINTYEQSNNLALEEREFLLHEIAQDRKKLRDKLNKIAATRFKPIIKRFYEEMADVIKTKVNKGEENMDVSQVEAHYHKISPLFEAFQEDANHIKILYRTLTANAKRTNISSLGSEWAEIAQTLNNPMNQYTNKEKYNEKLLLLNDFLTTTYNQAMDASFDSATRSRKIDALEAVINAALMPENAELKRAIEAFTEKNYPALQRPTNKITNMSLSVIDTMRKEQLKIDRLRAYNNYAALVEKRGEITRNTPELIEYLTEIGKEFNEKGEIRKIEKTKVEAIIKKFGKEFVFPRFIAEKYSAQFPQSP